VPKNTQTTNNNNKKHMQQKQSLSDILIWDADSS